MEPDLFFVNCFVINASLLEHYAPSSSKLSTILQFLDILFHLFLMKWVPEPENNTKYGKTDKIDYICTGGGALIRFLTGEELPVVKALRHGSGIGVKA